MKLRTISEGGGRVVLALSFLMAGCRVGTDLPQPGEVRLESPEAVEMAGLVLGETLANSVYSTNHVTFAHAHGSATMHTHPIQGPYVHDGKDTGGPDRNHHNLFNFDLATEVPCAGGGSVLVESVVNGQSNPAIAPGSVHYISIQTHHACSLRLESAGGGTFVLDAAPYLSVEAHAVNDGTTTRVYGSVEGALEWQAEAKGGTCQIEISYEASGTTLDQITDVGVTGSFCGLEISETMSLDDLLS